MLSNQCRIANKQLRTCLSRIHTMGDSAMHCLLEAEVQLEDTEHIRTRRAVKLFTEYRVNCEFGDSTITGVCKQCL